MNSGELGLESAKQPVVFLFPGLSGIDKEISLLRAGCSSSLRFEPIQLPDWSTIDYDRINLDGLVSHCVAQIELSAPHGSILLAGYSFGGHVALAVAAALEASGRRVGCLALLDTSAEPPIQDAPISLARPVRRLAYAIRTGAIAGEVGRIVGAVIIRLRNKSLSRFLGRLPVVGVSRDMEERIRVSITLSFNLPILEELLSRMATSDEAFIFPAVLFRCVEQASDATADLGWSRHLARLQVVPILGDHVSLTDPPNLQSLCASFSSVMSDFSTKVDEPIG
jgi:phthiocerol/phenolphthiocerol synthesis type-I polyketide synthase D